MYIHVFVFYNVYFYGTFKLLLYYICIYILSALS